MADAWAVIPARGLSKGIAKKNLQLVRGRSLVRRAVEAARSAASISKVVVSTDDSGIAKEASRAGAVIVRRPHELATDTASSESVLLHALNALETAGEILPQFLVMLQCTSPFTQPEDIDAALLLLLENSADSVVAAAKCHKFLWKQTGEGAAGVNHNHQEYRERRQDRSPEFVETGALYAFRVAGFRVAKHRFFGRTEILEVPSLRSIEIDDADDLVVAQAMAPLIDSLRMETVLPTAVAAIIFDFDGVMTDNRVIINQRGDEAVVCSRSDGHGIELLRQAGIQMAVISKEKNSVVAVRCAKMGIKVVQGVDSKLEVFRALIRELGVDPKSSIYVGNDVNDLPCLKEAGCGIAVADAHPLVLAEADIILSNSGGRGAVRELADMLTTRVSRQRDSTPTVGAATLRAF